MTVQALRFYFFFAFIAISLASCRKDEVVEEANTLGTYIIGDWKIDSVNLSGDYQSPSVSGEIKGTGFNVTGNWTFREDGTFEIKAKYNLTMSIAGNSTGYGTVDETIAGSYVIKGQNTIETTYDGGVRVYTIRNREATSFSALYESAFNEPNESGLMRYEFGISR